MSEDGTMEAWVGSRSVCPRRGERRSGMAERGWRLAGAMGAVVVFYLVRDLLLYLVLPLLVLALSGN